MGLLDGNLDPQSMATMQLAAGLLSPGSFGQGLGKGLEGYQGTMANAQTMQLRQQQIAQAKQQMAMEQMQMQMLQRKQAFAESFMSPGSPGPAPGTQAMAQGAQGGSVGPTVANANAMNQSPAPAQPGGSRLSGLSEDQIAGGVMGGMVPKELVELWKASRMGEAFQPGYRKDLNGKTTYYGDPTKGVTLDANGNIGKMPGSGAIAELAGEATAANEQAKNRNQLAPADRLVNGRPFGGTTADLLTALKPSAGASAPAPGNAHDYSQVSSGGGGAIDPTSTTGGTSGAPKSGATASIPSAFKPSQSTNGNNTHLLAPQNQASGANAQKYVGTGDADRPAILQAELAKTTDPEDRAALQKEIARLPRSAQAVGAQFTSPAESAADTLRATQAVHAATDGVVEFNKGRLEKAHADVQGVYSKLSDTVRSEAELQNRNNQILPMLDKIQTGGFAPEQRIAFANSLQTAGWVPDALKGKFSQWVANGDPTTGKVIENQLAAAGIKTMLDTLDKEGKPNRALFEAIHAAQESSKSGNATLKQVFGLQKQLYDWHYQQEQSLGQRIESPNYNPVSTLREFSAARNTSLQQAAPVATMRWNAKTGNIEKVQ